MGLGKESGRRGSKRGEGEVCFEEPTLEKKTERDTHEEEIIIRVEEEETGKESECMRGRERGKGGSL